MPTNGDLWELLDRNSEGFQLLLESGQECIVVIDREHRYLYANQAAHDYVGLTEGSLVGITVKEGLEQLPQLQPIWDNRIENVFRQGVSLHFEDDVQVSDRNLSSISTIFPIRARTGEIAAAGIVYHDVSSWRNGGRRPEGSTELLKMVCDNSITLLGIVTDRGEVLYANPAWDRVLGYTPGSLAAGADCIHSDDRKIASQYWDRVRQHPTGVSRIELRFRTLDGEYRLLECTARAIFFRDEPHYFISAHDISPYARHLHILSESERRYRGIVEKQSEPICRFYPDGMLSFMNDAFRRFFLIPVDCSAEGSITDYLPELDPVIIRRHLEDKAHSRPMENEYTCQIESGALLILECTHTGQRDEEGALLEIQSVFRDVTEIRRIERENREQEIFSAIGRMATVIAHDLRTPLTSIEMNIDMLLENQMREDQRAKSLTILNKEIRRIHAIVDDILDFSRLQTLDLSIFNIATLSDDIHNSTAATMHYNGIDLLIAIEPTEIMADYEKIRELILNLISNAIDAIEDHGAILIKGEMNREKNSYSLTVTDSGIGVNDPGKIFTSFYSTKDRGSGIGLPRAVKIAQSHGGSLILSSSKDEPTSFTLELPIRSIMHGAHSCL